MRKPVSPTPEPTLPNSFQAAEFALMLHAGVPPLDALAYFVDAGEQAPEIAHKWMHCEAVRKELRTLQGKTFQKMSLEERLQHAIEKHYSEMAYYLHSHNYNDLEGAMKQKADTCRTALEAKLAGMAGKSDAMTQFFNDLAIGKVKLTGSEEGVH